jgi:hypothetical protein
MQQHSSPNSRNFESVLAESNQSHPFGDEYVRALLARRDYAHGEAVLIPTHSKIFSLTFGNYKLDQLSPLCFKALAIYFCTNILSNPNTTQHG